MTDREIFRHNLSELLSTTNAKQIDIAKYAGVSCQTVSSWVCGRGYPRAESMELLCRYFGIRKADLLEEKSPQQTQEEKLVSLFRSLSAKGKAMLVERAEELNILHPLRGKKHG